jgi:hypothetical protein
MKNIALTPLLLFAALAAHGQPNSHVHNWTGVWQMTSPGKPGGTITLADDGGMLTGVIVFNVIDRKTGQRIAPETRTIVNPRVEGNSLEFQVRRILKPHLKNAPEENQPDPTDIADMILTATAEGKASLTCPKCGDPSPMEMVKER